MIKVNKGATAIKGDAIVILVELENAISGVRKALANAGLDEETTRELIAECGSMSFMTDEEREQIYIQDELLYKEILKGEDDEQRSISNDSRR